MLNARARRAIAAAVTAAATAPGAVVWARRAPGTVGSPFPLCFLQQTRCTASNSAEQTEEGPLRIKAVTAAKPPHGVWCKLKSRQPYHSSNHAPLSSLCMTAEGN